MGSIPQEDLLLFGDGSRPVVIHQLIEGGKLLRPQEVIPLVVSHDLEVLDIILVPRDQGKSKGVLHGDHVPAPRVDCAQGCQSSVRAGHGDVGGWLPHRYAGGGPS